MTASLIREQWEKKYENKQEGGYLIEAPARILAIRQRWERAFFKRRVFDAYQFSKTAAKALDVGCGDGKNALFFSGHFSEVVAIDFSRNVIERNNEAPHPANVTFVCSDVAEYLAGEPRQFDFIFVGGVFMYLTDEELKRTFALLMSRLGPGGLLVARESISSTATRVNRKTDYLAWYRHHRDYREGAFAAAFVAAHNNRGYKTMHVFGDLKKARMTWLLSRVTAPLLLALASLKDVLLARKNRTRNFFFFYRKP